MDQSVGKQGDHKKQSWWILALGALGVVYGDIGTSPLYALRECFVQPHGVGLTYANVMGLLSLMFWSLTFVIVIKYLSFVMRADNDGEGGIMSLMALVHRSVQGRDIGSWRSVFVVLGLIGTALLFADGVITPAISVLSAVEGLSVVTPALGGAVVPSTVGILVGLFLIQRRGTHRIANVFGPVMVVWFLTLAATGLPWIVKVPYVLRALNPYYAWVFVSHHGFHAILILGAVVLCITGAEALYADMGHFGRRAIGVAWFRLVYPALVINYLGQGAVLLERGESAMANPFYSLVPTYLLYPMVAIATLATVIASQALISGAFSLAQQAVQLGFLPRLTIRHTSGTQKGQIYVPEVNSFMMVGCILVVLGFRSSTGLAAAYGIAVTGTMIVTALLILPVAKWSWGWSWWKAGVLTVVFLVVDIPFFLGNIVKLGSGGWFPLVVGAGLFVVMSTWKKGRSFLAERLKRSFVGMQEFVRENVERTPAARVPGTAVFMTSNLNVVPPAMLHNFRHNKVIHERTVLLAITTEAIPEVLPESRIEIKTIGEGIFQVVGRYGFMQTPHVLELLTLFGDRTGDPVDFGVTSFYLGRETLLTSGPAPLMKWRKILFSFLSRNALTATNYFALPPDRVVELGMQVDL